MNQTFDCEDLVRRATLAYFRTAEGDSVLQPSNESAVRRHSGRSYVVLTNQNGVLAVYRVRPSGTLHRLRRWPSALA